MATKLQKASIAIRQNKGRDLSPKWDDTALLDGDAFHRHFHQAMAWYRLESSVKELKPKVIDWMGRNGYSKVQIQAFKKTKDNRCNLTMGAIAASLIKGMPDVHPGFRDGRSTVEWLKDAISKVVSEGRDDIDEDAEVKVEKPAVYVPSIQERLRDAAGAMSEDIDYAIDNFITDPEAFDPKAFKMISLLRGKGVKAAHARIIKGFFQAGHNELQELASGNADEQLKEGYSHLPRKHVRKLIDFYESIMTACDQIAAEQKVLKQPRA